MCETVKIGDIECKTPRELIDALGKDCFLKLDRGFNGLSLDTCLCCIDIEKTVEENGYELCNGWYGSNFYEKGNFKCSELKS